MKSIKFDSDLHLRLTAEWQRHNSQWTLGIDHNCNTLSSGESYRAVQQLQGPKDLRPSKNKIANE